MSAALHLGFLGTGLMGRPMAHCAAELYRLLVAQGRAGHEPSALVELLEGQRA